MMSTQKNNKRHWNDKLMVKIGSVNHLQRSTNSKRREIFNFYWNLKVLTLPPLQTIMYFVREFFDSSDECNTSERNRYNFAFYDIFQFWVENLKEKNSDLGTMKTNRTNSFSLSFLFLWLFLTVFSFQIFYTANFSHACIIPTLFMAF